MIKMYISIASINNLPMNAMSFPLLRVVSVLLAVFALPVEGALAQPACPARPPADVRVIVTTNPVKTDNSKSVAQLQNFKIDTVNPYGENALTEVGGLMSGGLQLKTDVEISWETDNRTACFWYKKVDVIMHIDPTIFIASAYPPGTCRYAAILEHENKHVMTDRIVAKYWRPKVEDYVQRQVNKIGVIGPYPASNVQQTRAHMTDFMAKAMEAVSKPVNEDRMRRQQAIDNRGEYDRVNNLCRNINNKINAAKQDMGLQ